MPMPTIDETVRALLHDVVEAPANADPRALLRKISTAVLHLAEQSAQQVQKLDLSPGDTLVVKLGNPQTGWIPGPEHEKAAKETFLRAIKEMGLEGKVSLAVVHYGHFLEVIHPVVG